MHRHDGFFMRMAVGYAMARSRGGHTTHYYLPYASSTSNVAAETWAQDSFDGRGPAVEFSLGGTPLDGLVIAGQVTSQMMLDSAVYHRGRPDPPSQGYKYTTWGVLIMYYPDSKAGFNAGIGIGRMLEHYPPEPSGWFVGPHLGYEWWVGKQTSFGVVSRAAFATLSASDFETQTARVAILSLLMEITYH